VTVTPPAIPTVDPTLYLAQFSGLDPELPLALLPIRMETRFLPEGDPTELRVRFFPDVLHADGHAATLTLAEQSLGRAYWVRVRGDDDGQDAAFAWLADRVGPWRAAWVAGQTRTAGAATRIAAEPVRARLLPSRFAVVGYDWGADNPIRTWWGAAIPADLPMAPAPVDAADGIDGRGLLDAQGLQWTYDFEAAEAVGMALRINLTTLPERFAQEGFGRLIAIGVRSGDQREALEGLLDAHRYTHGLDFIPQGTPTNSTETAPAGMSNAAPDLAALRAAELDKRPAATRPAVAADGDLYGWTVHDTASVALGLGRDNALDRASRAALAEPAHARAMSRTLWPATGGHYVDSLLEGTVTGAGRTWLRDWSTAYVRGAGPLPTLLVGPQPYGLLPVAKVERPEGTPASNVQELQATLLDLRPNWNLSVTDVPRLDPNATDVGTAGEGDLAGVASGLLASVPHATGFRLAHVDTMRSAYKAKWDFSMFWLGVQCLATPDDDGVAMEEDPLNFGWAHWTNLSEGLDRAETPEDQLDAVERFTDAMTSLSGSGNLTFQQRTYCADLLDYAKRNMQDLVAAHADRTEPMLWLAERVPGITRMMGDADDPSAFYALRPHDSPFVQTLVAVDRGPMGQFILRHLFQDVAQGLANGELIQHSYSSPSPLLKQLVHRSAEQALGTADVATLSSGLAGLEAVLDEDDPVGTLERLLREGLGPWAYRIDAWYTGLGAWRLENKRRKRPRGIQVGGFGWLLEVSPRPASTGPSQGYVLAPSLTHATTAAILRSGWSGFGGAFATDLSSDRIRRAHWIADGVRQGQDLGRLIGARFERTLQDAGLSAQIDAFRTCALAAVGSTAPPNAIVDGLLLARARSDAADKTDAELAATSGIKDVLADAPAVDVPGLETALDSLEADLDAVADASLAQTVFSLAQGNVPEASATLTASATGEISLPRLRVADTPREALTITHRLLLLLDPDASKGWPAAPASGRAAAAPGLELWAAGLLGAPGDYPFTVRFDDPGTGKTLAGPFAASVEDAGLSALDAVFLAPAGADAGLGRLGAVLTAWAEGLRPPKLETATITLVTDQGERTVDDLALACRALRRLLAEARDLDGRDLASPGAGDATSGFATSGVGERDLTGRLRGVRSRLVAGRGRLAGALPAADGEPRGDVRAAMVSLAGFELPGGVPTATDAAALAAAGAAVLAQIDARLAAYDALVAAEKAEWAGLGADARVRRLAARAHLLVGHAMPLAPHFAPANGADLDATFARPRLATRQAATGWLAASGRVDPGARRLRLAIDLTEAVRDTVAFEFSLGQLPDHEQEGWAAVEPPSADNRGRLCLLATGADARFAGGPVTGLVLGSWAESLARPGQDAGVAFHFDAPSARAPQAVLLGAVPEDPGYSFDAVVDLVDQSLDLATLRMVGPETLKNLGQYLPAVYLDGSTSAGELA